MLYQLSHISEAEIIFFDNREHAYTSEATYDIFAIHYYGVLL